MSVKLSSGDSELLEESLSLLNQLYYSLTAKMIAGKGVSYMQFLDSVAPDMRNLEKFLNKLSSDVD